WNAECTPFPDERPLQLKKSSVRTSMAATSISKAWLRCGDGFQSTSAQESPRLTDKKSGIKKHLGLLFSSAGSTAGAAAEISKEAEGIIWTSSGSDFSDDENKMLIPRLHSKKSDASKTEESPGSYNLLLEDSSSSSSSEEFIEWENDSDSTVRCDGSETDHSSLEISDSDSCTNPNSVAVEEESDELYKTTSAEISEYSSDNDS
ncbi:SPIDR protein, partial [Heliornis fulica]|nr:SPIDR protein [Heliornis fulica]